MKWIKCSDEMPDAFRLVQVEDNKMAFSIILINNGEYERCWIYVCSKCKNNDPDPLYWRYMSPVQSTAE